MEIRGSTPVVTLFLKLSVLRIKLKLSKNTYWIKILMTLFMLFIRNNQSIALRKIGKIIFLSYDLLNITFHSVKWTIHQLSPNINTSVFCLCFIWRVLDRVTP